MKTTDFVESLNKGPGGYVMVHPDTLATKIDDFLGDRKPVDGYDMRRIDFNEVGLPDGSTVKFEPFERRFFSLLYRHRGHVVSHEMADRALLNPDKEYHHDGGEQWNSNSSPMILKVYISKLRKKLGTNTIETVWGEGWSLV